MTKKSHARLLRDEKLKDARTEAASQIKGNAIYDDIKEVYTNCAKTLIGYNEALVVVCEPSLIPHMDDSQKQKIVLLTETIKKDWFLNVLLFRVSQSCFGTCCQIL